MEGYIEDKDYPIGRYRAQKYNELSIKNMIDIVYDALIERMKHLDIAKKHWVTARVVGVLTK